MRLLFVNEVQVLLLFKFVFHPAENLRTKKISGVNSQA